MHKYVQAMCSLHKTVGNMSNKNVFNVHHSYPWRVLVPAFSCCSFLSSLRTCFCSLSALFRFSVSVLMFSENVLLLSPLNGRISCSKLSQYRIAVTQSLNSDLRFVSRREIILFCCKSQPFPVLLQLKAYRSRSKSFHVIIGFQTKLTFFSPNLPQKPVLRSVKALLCISQ